jgi:hypothetical protein
VAERLSEQAMVIGGYTVDLVHRHIGKQAVLQRNAEREREAKIDHAKLAQLITKAMEKTAEAQLAKRGKPSLRVI